MALKRMTSAHHALYAAAFLAAWVPPGVLAAFPEHPVRFIVGFAPGGSNDIVARVLGQKLAATWGVPVVVDNRPGAAGNIAAEIAARAQPDGHTIHLVGANNTINAALGGRLAYDLRKDFAPVVQIVSVPLPPMTETFASRSLSISPPPTLM